MQKQSFPFRNKIQAAIGKRKQKAAGYLNAKTAGWSKRRQEFFLALTCLISLSAITGILVMAFIRPRTLPQIRQPPVRISIDSLQHLSPSKSIIK